MVSSLKIAILALIIVFLIFCKATAQTNVSGFISANTTWNAAGSPYIVIGNTLVSHGYTLTIDPGVVVKFNSAKALQIDGELIAIGTPQNRIIFTSINPTPIPGSWSKIHFADTCADAVFNTSGNYVSGCIMKYCDVLYGGNVGFGQIHIESSSPFISHCNIKYSGADGILCNNSNYVLDSSLVDGCGGYGLNFGTWCGTLLQGDSIMNNSMGGINLNGSCPMQALTIKNNYFYQNQTHGAISMTGSRKVKIRENNFINNFGQNCGIITFNNGMSIDTIECNTFINNSPSGINQAVITTNPYASRGIISDNLFDGNISSQGACITAIWAGYSGFAGSFTFTNNIIRNNTGFYGCYFSPEMDNTFMLNITNNVFYNNTANGVILIDGYQTNNSNITFLKLKYNSFLDSIQQIKLDNRIPYGSPNLYVDSNFWGSTGTSYLDSVIYDYFDDPTKTVVYYNPVLQSPLTFTSDCEFLQTGITGIQPPHFNLALYPNPASQYFTIEFDKIINSGTIEIYNLMGEKITHLNFYHASKKEIHLSNISRGIYFTKISADEKQFIKKILIQSQ